MAVESGYYMAFGYTDDSDVEHIVWSESLSEFDYKITKIFDALDFALKNAGSFEAQSLIRDGLEALDEYKMFLQVHEVF